MSKKVFMGGICGMGMAPLAMFLRDASYDVEGFDDSPNAAICQVLKSKGVRLTNSHTPQGEVDEFVITSALKAQIEKLKSTPCKKFLRRGEALAKIAQTRKLIGICGSHGKTTTTTLIAHAINVLGIDAGYITGAFPSEFLPAKFCDESKFFVAELDESDGTIENFSPQITVALNGDLDHTDTYEDFSALKKMFARLFSRTHQYVIIPEGDELLEEATRAIKAEVIRIKVPHDDFLVYDKQMALACLNAAFKQNFAIDIFDGFKGIARRQEIFENSEKVFAIADYAHHPREVEAFLEWLDKRAPFKKIIFFQPHRYTRTKHFGDEFKELFAARASIDDEVYILPVYAASEIYDELGCSKNIESYNVKLANLQEMKNIFEDFKERYAEKVCVAFIGAGDIYFEAKKIFSL